MADRRQRRRHRNPLRVILRWMLLFLAVILILIVGISLETVKMMSSAATEDKYKYASLLHNNPNYRKSIM